MFFRFSQIRRIELLSIDYIILYDKKTKKVIKVNVLFTIIIKYIKVTNMIIIQYILQYDRFFFFFFKYDRIHSKNMIDPFGYLVFSFPLLRLSFFCKNDAVPLHRVKSIITSSVFIVYGIVIM